MRPRTTGEILDDAWRLAAADAPLLLFFNALFLIPTFLVLLLLLTAPAAESRTAMTLPAASALLLSLTGLASGACQELFRRRIASEPARVRDCLKAALRHGLQHTAARAALLVAALLGPFIVVIALQPTTTPILKALGFLFGCVLLTVVSLPLWTANASLHVLIAEGNARRGTLFRELRRNAAAAPMKTAVVVVSRLPLLLLLAVQLHLLAVLLLWIADNLGGFETALFDAELSFPSNPLYTTALLLLSWLLLAPFFEAANFLLHIDIRTREEGLDLQYRVRRVFLAAVPILAATLLFGGSARADEEPLRIVRSVRQGVETIRAEMEKAEPYPGGRRWIGRLRDLGAELSDAADDGDKRFRWFDRCLVNFEDRKKKDALSALDDLHLRLSLLEDSLTAEGGAKRPSPEEIKALLRGAEMSDRERTRHRQRKEKQHKEREEVRHEDAPEKGKQPHGDGGGAAVGAPRVGAAGFSLAGWLLLAGMGLAVVTAGAYLYFSSRRETRTAKPSTAIGKETTLADAETRQVLEQSPSVLWQRAEKLAGEGQFREAVRLLYLAVLALLHRQQLIRFEPTRTNGEYVRQVRLSERAPDELHELFPQLTDLFEAKWYGERSCESGDYRGCRVLAEQIQQLSELRG